MATPPDPASTIPATTSAAPRRRMPRLETLKKRREFLAVRKGSRWAGANFVIEALERPQTAAGGSPRVGFTVSAQVGGAVQRNRIKRRLRAAVREVLASSARPDFDYVLIARKPALTAEFAVLIADLQRGLAQVHGRGRARGGRRPK